MKLYEDLLKKEDIRDFTYSTHPPSIHNLNLFLKSKTDDKYVILRKMLVLEMYDIANDKLSEEYLDELEALGIK
jgi:DNA-directed RNA polymerase subunit L